MVTQNLGTLKRITDLRGVWPKEPKDFSTWLSREDNFGLLGEAVGLDMIFRELESPVNNLSVDVFANEAVTNKGIIIENQLSDTDHSHLGKIIAYAAGKEAEIIIWLVKKAREEHKLAVNWLNQHSDDNISFYLVEIELWSISNSPPAPVFNVVERPNSWARNIKANEALSDMEKFRLEFWRAFNEYVATKSTFFKTHNPTAQPCYAIGLGCSLYHLELTINTQKKRVGAELKIVNEKDLYDSLLKQKKNIEAELETELEWVEANVVYRLLATKDLDVKNNSDLWEDAFSWFCDMAAKFQIICQDYIN